MTRTGTLVVVRWAVLAALACWTSLCAAENLPSLARSNAQGWTVSGEENPFRDGHVAPAAWQPTRDEHVTPPRPKSAPEIAKPAAKSAPTRWLTPTAQVTKQAPAVAQPRSKPTSTAVRSPKPFTPPSDAQLMAKSAPPSQQPAARKPAQQPEAPKPTVQTNKNDGANLYTGSAARVRPPEPKADTTNKSPRPNVRQAAHRPRPTPPSSKSFINGEGWIRPLRQVAYQVSGAAEEEMPMPPGQRSMMTGNPHGPNMSGDSYGPNMSDGNAMPSDEPYYEGGGMSDGGMYGEGWIGPSAGGPCGDGTCGPDGCCGPTCGDTCEPGCGCSGGTAELCSIGPHDDESCHTIRVRVPKCQEIMLFGGVHGFKGPFDQDRDSGNFGFQEGINFGAKLPFTDWGYQLGYQGAQSQLSGDADSNIDSPFTQHFWTTGVFHRTRDGLQGGLVWDVLLDSRDTTTDFHQLRGELSFVDCGCHEFGVMGNVHMADEVLFDNSEEESNAWQSTDQFLLFYRMHGKSGGEGRFFAGITDDSDAIVGADFLLPLKSHWSLQTGFTYLIPEEPAGEVAARQEAWNLGINLVWHWKGRSRECHSNPYRPLFNIADNGSMIIDDRP